MESIKTIYCELINQKQENNENEVLLKFGNDLGQISFNNDEIEGIKTLFNNILKEIINHDIEIILKPLEQQVKPAYIKDVAEEYVKQLNVELKQIKEHLNNRLNVNE